MNESGIAQLVGKTPSQWLHDGTSILVLIAIGGRVWNAITNGGGIVGIWHSLCFGVTPKPTDKQPPLTPSN